jgi:hypothetical protein
MIVEEAEFKGRPVLTIKFDENDKYPFSFGISKAKKILGTLDEIKAFVEKYDKPKPEAGAEPPAEAKEEPKPPEGS